MLFFFLVSGSWVPVLSHAKKASNNPIMILRASNKSSIRYWLKTGYFNFCFYEPS